MTATPTQAELEAAKPKVADLPTPKPTPIEQARTDRFNTLVYWFVRDVRCCSYCAMEYAIALVEFEAGVQWPGKPGKDCERLDSHGRTCRALVELFWANRPPRPTKER